MDKKSIKKELIEYFKDKTSETIDGAVTCITLPLYYHFNNNLINIFVTDTRVTDLGIGIKEIHAIFNPMIDELKNQYGIEKDGAEYYIPIIDPDFIPFMVYNLGLFIQAADLLSKVGKV